MRYKIIVQIVLIVLFSTGCKGPSENGNLTHTLHDSDRTEVLIVLLDSLEIDYEVQENTFTYPAENWQEFSEAEKDSFSAKIISIRNLDEKDYFESLLNKRDIRFLLEEQGEDYLWWPIDNDQEESILLQYMNYRAPA